MGSMHLGNPGCCCGGDGAGMYDIAGCDCGLPGSVDLSVTYPGAYRIGPIYKSASLYYHELDLSLQIYLADNHHFETLRNTPNAIWSDWEDMGFWNGSADVGPVTRCYFLYCYAGGGVAVSSIQRTAPVGGEADYHYVDYRMDLHIWSDSDPGNACSPLMLAGGTPAGGDPPYPVMVVSG